MDMITGGDYYQREGEEQGEVQMKQQYYDDQSTTICRWSTITCQWSGTICWWSF